MGIILYGGFLFILLLLLINYKSLWQYFMWLLVVSFAIFSVVFYPFIITYTIAIILIVLACFINIRALRKLWSYPLFNYLRRQNIKISPTEAAAIASGDTYWEAALFSNNLDYKLLFKPDNASLSDAENAFIVEKVPALCALFTQFGLGVKVLDYIKDNGFWALIIPKKYGGLEFSHLAHARVITLLTSCDVSLAVSVMVPNSLGPAELLLQYGTVEQKNNYLPKLANGTEVPCFALTSEVAGSDASSIIDNGEVCYGEYAGKWILGLKLNWRKRYTTLAPIATIIGLAFKVYDPNKLLSTKTELGITCALIPTATAGVKIGNYHKPIGGNFANGPNSGVDVFVPLDFIIGGSKYIGKGWQMLIESLAVGRGISLPSLAIASASVGLYSSVAYASLRTQFKQPIIKFGGIYEPIITCASKLYQMQAMSEFNHSVLDLGIKPSLVSAILKYHHTEQARIIINAAMDIHGGKAVMLGAKNYLGRFYQSMPIAITVEGANIITRSLMIYGQGLLRCHPYLASYVSAVSVNDKQYFDSTLIKHIGYIWHIKASAVIGAISGGIFTKLPKEADRDTKVYYRRIQLLSAAFALLTEVAVMRFGMKIKTNEPLSAKFADLLILLFTLSSVLRTYRTDKNKVLNKNLMLISAQDISYSCQRLLLDIIAHFDNIILRFLLTKMLLPFGARYKKPTPKLQRKLAKQLTTTDLVNNLVKDNIIFTKGQALDKLDQAFKMLKNDANNPQLKVLIADVLAVDEYDKEHYEKI